MGGWPGRRRLAVPSPRGKGGLRRHARRFAVHGGLGLHDAAHLGGRLQCLLTPLAPGAPRAPFEKGPAMNQPPVAPHASPAQRPPEILGGLIPRNGQALAAYYCGVFSLIPGLGAILGPLAVIFGVRGLRTANREPQRKGKVHAWVGIVAGGLFGLVNLAGAAIILVVELFGINPFAGVYVR
jgi:hypothetical protein